MKVSLPEPLRHIFGAISKEGGRAILVGGFVRDLALGRDTGEYDVEVHGIEVEPLQSLLSRFGEVITVGKSFGVLMVKGLDVDFALPRRDSKVAKGHRGIAVETDPGLSFPEAARRRDFTVNSMGFEDRKSVV